MDIRTLRKGDKVLLVGTVNFNVCDGDSFVHFSVGHSDVGMQSSRPDLLHSVQEFNFSAGEHVVHIGGEADRVGLIKFVDGHYAVVHFDDSPVPRIVALEDLERTNPQAPQQVAEAAE